MSQRRELQPSQTYKFSGQSVVFFIYCVKSRPCSSGSYRSKYVLSEKLRIEPDSYKLEMSNETSPCYTVHSSDHSTFNQTFRDDLLDFLPVRGGCHLHFDGKVNLTCSPSSTISTSTGGKRQIPIGA